MQVLLNEAREMHTKKVNKTLETMVQNIEAMQD